MLFGGLLMLLFWVGLIVLVVFAVRALVRSGRGWHTWSEAPRPGSKALDVLKERYARGEITKEQYDQMRKDLDV